MDLLHAGAATVTAQTAFQGIKDVLKVRRGQIVLIFGGTGAVGWRFKL
jgi:NADPH:quinone reductase-like Zn-dependent oxidoreductase